MYINSKLKELAASSPGVRLWYYSLFGVPLVFSNSILVSKLPLQSMLWAKWDRNQSPRQDPEKSDHLFFLSFTPEGEAKSWEFFSWMCLAVLGAKDIAKVGKVAPILFSNTMHFLLALHSPGVLQPPKCSSQKSNLIYILFSQSLCKRVKAWSFLVHHLTDVITLGSQIFYFSPCTSVVSDEISAFICLPFYPL